MMFISWNRQKYQIPDKLENQIHDNPEVSEEIIMRTWIMQIQQENNNLNW